MAVVDLPPDLAPVNSFLDLIDQSVVYTDPRTSNALRQFRAQPIWRAQLEFQELRLDKWRALTGLLAKLRGSVNSIRLHDFSDPGDDFARSGRYFTDGTGFDDGTFFDEQPIKLVATAAVGGESLVVQTTVPGGIELPAGYKLGLPDDRLYITTDAVSLPEGVTATIPIRPGISAEAVAGTQVKTYKPTTRLYRVGADPIPRDVSKFGSVTLSFTEEPRT